MSDPDEELARRLQAEEFRQSRQQQELPQPQRPSQQDQPRSRSLLFTPIPISPPPPAATSPRPVSRAVPQQPAVMAVTPGSATIVFLRHVATRRQIGEALKLSVTTERLVYFELANSPGKRLVVQTDGSVSFSFVSGNIPASLFEPEVTPNGCMMFRSVEFRDAVNNEGGVGWYLSIDARTGQMIGMAAKNNTAAWLLTNASHTAQPVQARVSAEVVHGVGVPVAATAPSSQPQAHPRQEIISWLASADGQQWLAGHAHLRQLYSDGHLIKLLYRTDWMTAAERWTPNFQSRIAFNSAHCMGDQSLQGVVRDGYVCLENVIPKDLCTRALRVINYYLAQPECAVARPEADGKFNVPGHISSDPDIMALFYESPLVSYAQQLLGVEQIQAVNVAQIELRYPELGEPHRLSGRRWYIDGFTSQAHSPHSLLFAVPLTDQSEPWTGNFIAFPGSHISLMEHVREAVSSESSRVDLSNELDLSKPDLGEPTQALMQPGGVLVAHPKLAMRSGLNYGPHVRHMIYFRVQHVDHAQLQQLMLDSPWIEFEGLVHLI